MPLLRTVGLTALFQFLNQSLGDAQSGRELGLRHTRSLVGQRHVVWRYFRGSHKVVHHDLSDGLREAQPQRLTSV